MRKPTNFDYFSRVDFPNVGMYCHKKFEYSNKTRIQKKGIMNLFEFTHSSRLFVRCLFCITQFSRDPYILCKKSHFRLKSYNNHQSVSNSRAICKKGSRQLPPLRVSSAQFVATHGRMAKHAVCLHIDNSWITPSIHLYY